MSVYILRTKHLTDIAVSPYHHFRDKCGFFGGFFLLKFKMDAQNGRGQFSDKLTDVSVYTICPKYLVQIALSHSFFYINAFLCLTQKFKMATKNGERTISFHKLEGDHAYTLHPQNSAISHHFQDNCVFAFYTEIRDGQITKMAKITISHNISEILRIHH